MNKHLMERFTDHDLLFLNPSCALSPYVSASRSGTLPTVAWAMLMVAALATVTITASRKSATCNALPRDCAGHIPCVRAWLWDVKVAKQRGVVAVGAPVGCLYHQRGGHMQ